MLLDGYIIYFLRSEYLQEKTTSVYSYFEKGCRKKCARDNPER